MNALDIAMTNHNAEVGEIIPAGISRTLVLMFCASIFLSTYRLKAIAALLAKIIQASISEIKFQSNG